MSLSRACLGKLIILSTTRLKKNERFFLPHLFEQLAPLAAHRALDVDALRKRHSFFELFLCLSRACLGKMMHFI